MTDPRDDITTRAASYAAGALTAAERRDIESDLRRDRRLATEVREFSETAALIGLAAPAVAPDPALRAGILDAIAELPQDSRVVRGPWLSRPVVALLGAAAAAVLAVAGTMLDLDLDLVPREPSVVDQIVAAADYESASGDVVGGGTVKAIWSDSLDRAALLVSDLGAPPSGRTYQMWFIDAEGAATPAGTFVPASAGTQSFALDGEMERGDAIGITVEPAGGSPSPTTTPIVVIATA